MELSESALAVYRTVVRMPTLDADQLAAALDLPVELVDRELRTLAQAGLLSASLTPSTPLLAAADPQIGLALLAERAVWEMQEREAELARSRQAIAGLLTELSRPAPGAAVTELDPASATARVEWLLRRSTSSLAVLADRRWLAQQAAGPLPHEVLAAAADRGVRIRVIVDQSLAEAPALFGLAHAVGTAAQWRRYAGLPVGMVAVDADGVVLFADATTFLTAASTVHAMLGLFDVLWESAPSADLTDAVHPVSADDSADDAPAAPADHARILALLAKGLTDDSIARNTGLSLRSVTRLTSEVMATLGATTRFQAGAEAARREVL